MSPTVDPQVSARLKARAILINKTKPFDGQVHLKLPETNNTLTGGSCEDQGAASDDNLIQGDKKPIRSCTDSGYNSDNESTEGNHKNDSTNIDAWDEDVNIDQPDTMIIETPDISDVSIRKNLSTAVMEIDPSSGAAWFANLVTNYHFHDRKIDLAFDVFPDKPDIAKDLHSTGVFAECGKKVDDALRKYMNLVVGPCEVVYSERCSAWLKECRRKEYRGYKLEAIRFSNAVLVMMALIAAVVFLVCWGVVQMLD
jgi:hypothetical protein